MPVTLVATRFCLPAFLLACSRSGRYRGDATRDKHCAAASTAADTIGLQHGAGGTRYCCTSVPPFWYSKQNATLHFYSVRSRSAKQKTTKCSGATHTHTCLVRERARDSSVRLTSVLSRKCSHRRCRHHPSLEVEAEVAAEVETQTCPFLDGLPPSPACCACCLRLLLSVVAVTRTSVACVRRLQGGPVAANSAEPPSASADYTFS